jgi:cytochrome c-type biogenesis protein CcmE
VTSKAKIKILKILSIGILIISGVCLILYGASDNITFFYKPSDLTKLSLNSKNIRIGGLVEKNSIHYRDINSVSFVLTDYKTHLQVYYTGVIPALFKDKQGVVVKGNLQNDGTFIATEMLAKHDENYLPPSFKTQNK